MTDHLPGTVGRRTIRLLLAGAAAFAVWASAAPARATDSAAPATAGTVTFGVQPASATGAPDARPDFSYTATPGASLSDQAAVHNYGTSPLTLTLGADDAFNAADGAFDLYDDSHPSTGIGAWTALGRATVTIPARSTAVVPFRITVPADATPGDHVGGIVAVLTAPATDARGDRIAVEHRVGSRVYLRVSGPLQPQLTVTSLHTAFATPGNPAGGGRLTVTYTVHNTGNVQLSAVPAVHAGNGLGGYGPAGQQPAMPALLPGGSATLTAVIDGVTPAVLTHVTVTLTPEPVPGQADPALAAASWSTSVWTIPWSLLGVLVVLVVGAVVWRVLRGRAGV